MLIAHIGAMDCFARGLRIAAEVIQQGLMDRLVKVSKSVCATAFRLVYRQTHSIESASSGNSVLN